MLSLVSPKRRSLSFAHKVSRFSLGAAYRKKCCEHTVHFTSHTDCRAFLWAQQVVTSVVHTPIIFLCRSNAFLACTKSVLALCLCLSMDCCRSWADGERPFLLVPRQSLCLCMCMCLCMDCSRSLAEGERPSSSSQVRSDRICDFDTYFAS